MRSWEVVKRGIATPRKLVVATSILIALALVASTIALAGGAGPFGDKRPVLSKSFTNRATDAARAFARLEVTKVERDSEGGGAYEIELAGPAEIELRLDRRFQPLSAPAGTSLKYVRDAQLAAREVSAIRGLNEVERDQEDGAAYEAEFSTMRGKVRFRLDQHLNVVSAERD
jgi:hypothetical protein